MVIQDVSLNTSRHSQIVGLTLQKLPDGSYFGKGTFDLFTHRRSFINVPNEYVFSPLAPHEFFTEAFCELQARTSSRVSIPTILR